MDNMICKGWEKTWVLKSFNEQFQLEAMEVNFVTPLFSINFNLKIKYKKRRMTTLIQIIPCLKSWNNV
jgi:hypothetical protein